MKEYKHIQPKIETMGDSVILDAIDQHEERKNFPLLTLTNKTHKADITIPTSELIKLAEVITKALYNAGVNVELKVTEYENS